MKRLIKSNISQDVIDKAKDLCKSLNDALKKNDRDKLMELKDEIYVYHPEIAYNDYAYRSLIFKKDDLPEFNNQEELKKILRKKIYLDGEACSFAKTLKGAETGCKDWNSKSKLKNSYIVTLKQKVNGIQLNKIAEICEKAFSNIKDNAQKSKKNVFKNFEKEMKSYHEKTYHEVDEVVAILDKTYEIVKILDMDK